MCEFGTEIPDDDIESPYCERCGSCGETGCCSPLNCAWTHMVENVNDDSGCLYGEENYKDIEFNYLLANALYDKFHKEPGAKETWDKIFTEVYGEK